MSDDVTINERARINLPVAVVWSGAIVLGTMVAIGVGTYLGFKNDVQTIRAELSSMGHNIEKIANRVEAGPSRREFDLALERIRLLESKVRGE